MNECFDVVMEFLSDEDKKYFNERDEKAKKALDDLKPKMKKFKELCTKIDAYIKKHPGCDTYDEDHPELWDNCERMVFEAKEILDDFLFQENQYRAALTKISKRTESFSIGWILSFAITVMSCILLPTFGQKAIGLIGGGSLTVLLGNMVEGSSKKDKEVNTKKFEEWAETNPKNVDAMMKKMDDMIENTWDEFCDKYQPWITNS